MASRTNKTQRFSNHAQPVSSGRAAFRIFALMAAWLLVAAISVDAGPRLGTASQDLVWIGPDGQPLPFSSHAEVQDFLLTATVVESKRIGHGINNPRKVLLEKDGVQAHAVFRDVRVEKFKKTETGVPVLFRDEALFEVAAYELGLLLGLDCVPPAVERKLYNTTGSLQLWIERATSEKKRKDKDITPPGARYWQLQLQIMRVFDSLVGNEDRNQGNMLFDPTWKLWLIDHTRSFRRTDELVFRDAIWFCERVLFGRLKDVSDKAMAKAVSAYLYPKEVKALLRRRAELVKRIEWLVEKRGAKLVLFDLPDVSEQTETLSASAEVPGTAALQY